jgi:hypothetical protein
VSEGNNEVTGSPGAGGIEPVQGLDRRAFLKRTLLGLTGVATAAAGTVGGEAAAATRRPAKARRPGARPAVAPTVLASGVTAPVATWLIAENAKPGTIDWVVTGIQTPHVLEGYASAVSAVPGDELNLFVNTSATSFHVEAYRMGYYQGLGGRLIARTEEVGGQRQAPSVLLGGAISTVSCPWEPSVALRIDKSWPPGMYLLKLVGDAGQQQYVPLCVRDDASTAAYVLQNSVTTWQAYNLWGGYSLYYGMKPGGGQDFAHRARAVSFDRPYPQTWAQGSADFFGNEFPVLYQMESLGLDMTYWTDVDLHANPTLLANHQCLISLGHDEYWSNEMRTSAAKALNSGVNLAFLGANACYRQIRMQPTSVGPNRLEVCYKSAADDPMATQQPSLTTVNWEQPPVSRPESTLIGSMYQSVGANANMTVTDAAAWFWDGCNLVDGQQLPLVVQGEYDRYVPSMPGPTNTDVFAHSPIPGQANWSDLTYYTTAGGGGAIAAGSASFVNKLSNTTAFPWNIVPRAIPALTPILLRAMENVYGTFGNGPAGASHAATGNWRTVYQGAAAAAGSAPGTAAA